ncbi:MAG TPA: uracil-DNA glycosylase family protein [Candidatus Lokiarchaeia archaeon]|nr:uracil-DNA glycosylase family protein [Candidatus Lokiarchaeia archaeon]
MGLNNDVNLTPYFEGHLEILFVPLNPAEESNAEMHYFSGKEGQAFWDLLHPCLIDKHIEKRLGNVYADDIVFGGTSINHNHWRYGIHDLMCNLVNSKSEEVTVEDPYCEYLVDQVKVKCPDVVVLFGNDVQDALLSCLDFNRKHTVNQGEIGKIMRKCDSNFFLLAFPCYQNSGSYPETAKRERYKEIRQYLESIHS